MPAELILAFWGVSFLFCLTPGVDWAYLIAAGLQNRSPLPAIVGMLAGHLLATVLVAAGIGALIATVPIVLTIITAAGALYLAVGYSARRILQARPTATRIVTRCSGAILVALGLALLIEKAITR